MRVVTGGAGGAGVRMDERGRGYEAAKDYWSNGTAFKLLPCHGAWLVSACAGPLRLARGHDARGEKSGSPACQ